MKGILVRKRQLVLPGDTIAEGEQFKAGLNTYKFGNKIIASRVGLVEYNNNIFSVIPLEGRYIPNVGDLIIGKIQDIEPYGWMVEINSPYKAILPIIEAVDQPIDIRRVELSKIFDIGDYIFARIIAYDRTRDPIISVKGIGKAKITEGKVIKISPVKIPRVIGRGGSMINLIKNETECRIVIGQNGYIHVVGKTPKLEDIAIKAIHKVEVEAHLPGLTDRIKLFIKKIRKEVGD